MANRAKTVGELLDEKWSPFLYCEETPAILDGIELENPLSGKSVENGSTKKATRSDINETATSEIQLDDWIEKLGSESDMKPRREFIHSLAGYVNVAYPILKSLRSSRLMRSESSKTHTKELQLSVERTVSNLQRFSNTMSQVQKAIDSTALPSSTSEAVIKEVLRRRSTRMVENCELLNALINIINRSGLSRNKSSLPSKSNLTFGSSIALD